MYKINILYFVIHSLVASSSSTTGTSFFLRGRSSTPPLPGSVNDEKKKYFQLINGKKPPHCLHFRGRVNGFPLLDTKTNPDPLQTSHFLCIFTRSVNKTVA